MVFKEITCKLGTMRKAVEWVLCPQESGKEHLIIIQSDTRIARIDLNEKKGFLSSGKGGHPGFHMLSPQLGATLIDVPDDIIDRLKKLVDTVPQVGPVVLSGKSVVITG